MGERVYFRRYEPWDVNVGVVVGSEGVLIVDTRANEAEARELLDDVGELDRRRPRWIVNTHAHFDHVGGNPTLRPAEAWGHPALEATVVPPPDHPVEDRAVLHLGGERTVIMRHLGLGHTNGDIVVAVPDAAVVFAGDLVEESGPPAYGDDSFPLDWPVTNARLLGLLDPAVRVVPGHGDAVDRPYVVEQQRALVEVAQTIRFLWVGEVPLASALAAGAARWPWPPEVLADAVARGYQQLRDLMS